MRRALIPILSIILILLLSTLINFRPIIQPVKAQQQPNQAYSDNFNADSGLWQYLGSAYRDPTNDYIVLTNSGYDQAGIALFNYPIQESFTANFTYKVGGGSYSGDGFTMFFYKQPYSTFDNGGNLGFNSQYAIIPGYGIEFDGWQNPSGDFQSIAGGQINPPTGDPSNAYIGLIEDFVGNHLAYVNDQRVDDNNWHQVSVQVQGSSVSVYVDKGLVLQWTGVLNRTYDGFGFSGGNGEVGSNYHIISNFSITAHNLQTPSLTTSCISSVSQSSLNVNINGFLTSGGTGISGAPILFSYSVTGGESWQDLTLVNTGSDGSYSALWFPPVTGNYLLKAVYEGNENYSGTSNVVNFAMAPGSEQSVFSVTSNSTLSELSFNSTNKELSFSVSGELGTMGYVNVDVPKSLINDISGVEVYLDNNKILYTAQSQSDCWILYFTYHHSTHNVAINLGSPTKLTATSSSSSSSSISPLMSTSQQSSPSLPIGLTVAVVIMVVMAVAIGAFSLGKRTERNKTRLADYQI